MLCRGRWSDWNDTADLLARAGMEVLVLEKAYPSPERYHPNEKRREGAQRLIWCLEIFEHLV